MENAAASNADFQSSLLCPEAIRAGLLRNKHGSLREWAEKRGLNYNTAWAAIHGRRNGPKARRALIRARRDANV